MDTYPFPQKFNIFKNDRKQKPNDPDYFILVFKGDGQGSERVGACWLKEGKSGKYFSCSQARKAEPPQPLTEKAVESANLPQEEHDPWPRYPAN